MDQPHFAGSGLHLSGRPRLAAKHSPNPASFTPISSANWRQALHAQGINNIFPGDGLNLWLPLAEASQNVAFALAKSGWLVREGDAFGVNTPAQGLRITLSTLNDNDINRLAGHLHQALSQ